MQCKGRAHRMQRCGLRSTWTLVLLLLLAAVTPGAHASCNATEREVDSACLAGLVRDVMHVVQTNASM